MNIPSLSGADLSALSFEEPDFVRLSVVLPDGVAASLLMEGVEAFQADAIRQGNVVESLRVVEDVGLAEVRLRRAFPDMVRHGDRWLAGVVARIGDRSLRFLELRSSYGIRMSGLCRSVVFEAGAEPAEAARGRAA